MRLALVEAVLFFALALALVVLLATFTTGAAVVVLAIAAVWGPVFFARCRREARLE